MTVLSAEYVYWVITRRVQTGSLAVVARTPSLLSFESQVTALWDEEHCLDMYPTLRSSPF